MLKINTNSLIFKILDQPLRIYFLILFSTAFVFWGTSWELIGLNLTPSFLWVGISCFICLFFNKENLKKNEFYIIGFMLLSLFVFTIIGLPQILSSDDPTRDINYLIGYDIRFIFAVLTFFALINLIKKETDFDLIVFCMLTLFILLSVYLTWKYLYVFQVNYVGVVITDGPSYANKNSLGTALALFFPFFIAGVFRRKQLMLISLVGLVTLLIFAFNLSSRSVLIIIGIEILSLMYFSKSKTLKRATGILSATMVLIILIAGISLYDWVRKQGDFAPTYQDSIPGQEEPFVETHRAWLVFEGLRGFVGSGGLGNGVATFRIRPSNEGSRTETHNDYVLLLYEQGIIGVSLLLFLFYSRIRKTIKFVSETGNKYAEASLASLFGLVVAMVFINMLNTMVFWSLLALNYSLLEIIKKHEEDIKYHSKNIDKIPKINRSLI